MKRFFLQLAGSSGIIGLSVLLNLLVQILLSRYFGLATLGSFGLWRNNVMLGGALARLGGHTLALKELPKHRETMNRRGSKAIVVFALKALALGLLGLGLFALTGVFTPLTDWPLFMVSAAAFGLAALGAAMLRGTGSVLLAIGIDRLLILSLLCIGIWVVKDQSDPPLRLLYLGAVSALLVLAWALTLKRLHALPGDDTTTNAPYARQAAGYFALDIGSTLGGRGSLLVAGLFLSGETLGQLVFMLMLGAAVSLPLLAVNQVIAPRISAAGGAGRWAEVRKLLFYGRAVSGGLGAMAAVILFAIYPIAESLASAEGAVIPGLLILLFVANAVNALGGSVATGMAMLGLQERAAKILFVAVAIKLIALAIALPVWGIWSLGVIELLFMMCWNGALYIALGRGLTRLEEQA